MAKLTLSVDEPVVARAKLYAERRGTSLSALVERYFEELTRPRMSEERTGSSPQPLPPITARLAGALKETKVDLEDYRRYLARKYR